MKKWVTFNFCIIVLFAIIFPNFAGAQWRTVNRLNNGFEIQSVNEHYKVNDKGNYVVTVKRYFPMSDGSNDFYQKNHVTNINTFEVHSNLNKYRQIGDEWLDSNGKRTSFDDYSYPNSRDPKQGWKKIYHNERSSWENIWREVLSILPKAFSNNNLSSEKRNSTSNVLSSEKTMVSADVGQEAEYPGGQSALVRFISSNLKYPEEARDNNIQGKVILRLLVEEDGSVSDICVSKSAHKLLDNEALRIAKKMPRFKPAVKNGVPVRSYFNLPVSFKLAN